MATCCAAIIVGRGPWGNMFEFSVAFATSIVVGYLVLSRRYPIRSIGFIPVGVALALLLYASTLPHEISPLVPGAPEPAAARRSTWAWRCSRTGSSRRRSRPASATWSRAREDRFAWLPSHRVLDEVAYRAVIIGFPIFATMIILGSWWASIAWSPLLGLGPEGDGGARDVARLRGLPPRPQPAGVGRPARRRCSSSSAFAMVLVTYSGSLWFSGLHAYSGL